MAPKHIVYSNPRKDGSAAGIDKNIDVLPGVFGKKVLYAFGILVFALPCAPIVGSNIAVKVKIGACFRLIFEFKGVKEFFLHAAFYPLSLLLE